MDIRECKPEDLISLLHCASDDKEMSFLDNWAQYQAWLIDALQKKNWHVIVADDGYGVIGFLVWNEYRECWKHISRLNYIYVNEDNRDDEVSGMLVVEYAKSTWSSSAQYWIWDTKVLPHKWIDKFVPPQLYDKYTTYHIKRTDELREWYNDVYIQRK